MKKSYNRKYYGIQIFFDKNSIILFEEVLIPLVLELKELLLRN